MEQCAKCGAYLMDGETTCSSCRTSVKGAIPSRSPTMNSGSILLPPDSQDAKKFGEAKITEQVNLQLLQQEQQADLIVRGLAKYYLDFIRPLEEATHFELFSSPSLTKIDFYTAPQVLLLGGYSTGKTSFINYLVERQVIGTEIGDQPTTATIHAIMGLKPGQHEAIILGNAAAADVNLPFHHLQKFGAAMLSRFQVSYCDSPILEKLTFIDSPGILAGQKQREHRDYNFTDVIRQFGANSSMILVFFDAHKLDISDEMRDALMSLRGFEDRLFIVLNKADSLSSQNLVRVYGSLMWSLGRVFTAPEALRVYIGSFWAEPYRTNHNRELLEAEESSLLQQIRSLPKAHSIRLVNEIVKRARQVKTHALILNQLKTNFGVFTSKEKKQREILSEAKLVEQFKKVQAEHNLAIGDFPKMSHFVEKIEPLSLWKIQETSKSQIQKLDWILSTGIPNLMRQSQEIQLKLHQEKEANIKKEAAEKKAAKLAASSASPGSSLSSSPEPTRDSSGFNPFDDDDHLEQTAPVQWSIPENLRKKWYEQFSTLKLVGGRLSGAAAKPLLQTYGLSGSQLKKIWATCDMDKQFSGYLDVDEFVLCMFLVEQTVRNGEVPEMIPEYCPPSKRHLL